MQNTRSIDIQVNVCIHTFSEDQNVGHVTIAAGLCTVIIWGEMVKGRMEREKES